MNLAEKPSLGDKLFVMLVAAYIGISGIFWFPGVPYAFFNSFKIFIFISILMMALINNSNVAFSKTTKRFLVGLFICAAAGFLSGVFHEDISAGVKMARIFVLPAFWLLALSCVRPRAHRFLLRSVATTTTFFLVMAMYPVAAYTGLLENHRPPLDFIPEHVSDPEFAAELGSIAGGGFAGQSTTWGVIVPTVALLAIALYSRNKRLAFKIDIITITLILISIASVIVTSARGGSLTLIAVGIYALTSGRNAIRFFMFALAGILILLGTISLFDLLPDNYFRGFESGSGTIETLDRVTTGRLFTFIHAINSFVSSPLIGVGSEGARLYGLSIHNTFLKLLAEGGLFLFIPVIYVTMHLILLALQRPGLDYPNMNSGGKWPNARFVIIAGLVLANFEPGTIFGNFNSSSAFWFAVWLRLQYNPSREQ